jgi:hypothetical protein
MHGTRCIKIMHKVCSQTSPPSSTRDKPTDKCGSTHLMYQNKLPKLRKLLCKVKIPLVKPSIFLTPLLRFLKFMYFCIKLIFLLKPDTTEYINPFSETDVCSGLIFTSVLTIYHNIITYDLIICNIPSLHSISCKLRLTKPALQFFLNNGMKEQVYLWK